MTSKIIGAIPRLNTVVLSVSNKGLAVFCDYFSRKKSVSKTRKLGNNRCIA